MKKKQIKNWYRFISLALFTVMFLIVLSAAGVVVAADKTVNLRILSSWGTEYNFTTAFVIPYVDALNKRSNGKVKASWVGPEAVPPFEQLQPLSKGLFDMVFTHPAYHMGSVTIGVAMDLFPASPKERFNAGFFSTIDKGYEKYNAKVLANVTGKGIGYQLIMRNKCISKADFTGLKLRTTPSYDPLANALKAATVKVPGGEIYSALEKGVVDGAFWVVVGALSYKWYEVAKYQLRPQFGEVAEILLINKDKWKAMPKDTQKLVEDITMEMAEEAYQVLGKSLAEEDAKLDGLGMKLCTLPEAEGKKLQKTYYDRSWEDIILKHSPELGAELKKKVDKFVQK